MFYYKYDYYGTMNNLCTLINIRSIMLIFAKQ